MRICYILTDEEGGEVFFPGEDQVGLPQMGATIWISDPEGEIDGEYEVLFYESFMGYELEMEPEEEEKGFLGVFLFPVEVEESEKPSFFKKSSWEQEYNRISKFFE